MSGGEAVRITKDKEEPRYLPVRSNVVNTTIQAEPWQTVHLTFEYNFFMQNAQEQRERTAGSDSASDGQIRTGVSWERHRE